ncbi:Cysteinyl-tRNA synthetase [Mycoplasma suis KI3806]|uniref:Cysteinyl-tRNA synthetase n=1 Tax=Mycoplasma suis (strain KI_3806) TaxID=708248 RepID=F0V3B8_MYCS3|nr:class I tRNA ligase family protein [Mycoplasma suis]CBZ40340.1 Cysteinyl-tRNA synthetase [Mycoplasma suis KI3806]
MNLWLFDTLSRSKKSISEEPVITIYLCGPTLYNYLHLGNLRPIVVFDFLIRYFKIINQPYKYVQNLTDIDEKIILKAKHENKTVKEIVDQYAESFFNILKNLNIVWPDQLPAVSTHIKNIQFHIDSLLKQGKAVWDKKTQTIRFLNTGKEKGLNYFSGNEVDEEDSCFALWKENNHTSYSWESPWFPGIPGWHLECFAMIEDNFSLPITIHGGGVDLKFPHHENENLLCRFWHNHDLAKVWVHVGQVLNEAGKLSKSSNYSLAVEECAEQYSWNFLRYIFMKVRYNKPFMINKEALSSYWSEWKSYLTALNYAEITLLNAKHIFFCPEKELRKIEKPDETIVKHLENDLNLPELLSWLEDLKKTLLNSIKKSDYDNILFYWKKLLTSLEVLGFTLERLSRENIDEAERWFDLLSQKNYEEADKLRLRLTEKGILP